MQAVTKEAPSAPGRERAENIVPTAILSRPAVLEVSEHEEVVYMYSILIASTLRPPCTYKQTIPPARRWLVSKFAEQELVVARPLYATL